MTIVQYLVNFPHIIKTPVAYIRQWYRKCQLQMKFIASFFFLEKHKNE